MFGLFRYMLAVCVAISHLWSGTIGGPAAYAVWGFYCLSGFLMTLVLQEKYGFSMRGIGKFAANRAMRIYPAYFAVCLGMFGLFTAVPNTASAFLPNLQMPHGPWNWLFTVTLLTPFAGGELIHGSLALSIELCYYIFMALGLAKSRRIAMAWFAVSLGYVAYLLAAKVGFAERYVGLAACSLAFSSGSLLCHCREWLPRMQTLWPALASVALWWGHVWLSWRLPGGPWVYGLYTSLIFSCAVIVTLMNLAPKQMPEWLAKLDRLAGDLSYPVYLAHWGVAVCVAWLVPGWSRSTFALFAVAFPLVNLLAWLIVRVVERPLQSLKFSNSRGNAVSADEKGATGIRPHFELVVNSSDRPARVV